MATIHVRTNDQRKKAVQQILDTLGIDLSTAINMYLVQIIVKQGIPFEIVTENGLTPDEEKEILKEIAWAKKHGKRYSSPKEMFKDIEHIKSRYSAVQVLKMVRHEKTLT